MCWNPNCPNYKNFNVVCPGCSGWDNDCDYGSHCNNFNTNGLYCNDGPWSNDSIARCGCPFLVNSNCVFYSGNITPCLAIATNTSLTDVINKIDSTFCNFISPSGNSCTVIIGQSGQIIATSLSPSGTQCSSYNISIDPVIINQINNNTTNISNLYTIIGGSITSVTTNTPDNLSITYPSSGVVNIDFIPTASGVSGILWSDYSPSTTTGTSFQTLKTYTINAGTLSSNGDKIVVNTQFLSPIVVAGSGSLARIQFNGSTIVQNWQFSSVNLTMMQMELWIVRVSNTSVNLILKVIDGTDNSGYYQTFGTQALSYVVPISALNLSMFSYSINCDVQSNISGDSSCSYLEVEYKKKL